MSQTLLGNHWITSPLPACWARFILEPAGITTTSLDSLVTEVTVPLFLNMDKIENCRLECLFSQVELFDNADRADRNRIGAFDRSQQ